MINYSDDISHCLIISNTVNKTVLFDFSLHEVHGNFND